MKKDTLSKLTLASLLVGLSAAGDAQAATQLNVTELGTGSQIRTQLMGQASSSQTPMQLAENKDGEAKCGEAKCGDEKKGGEAKCGEKKGGEAKCGEKEGGEAKCGEGK